MRNLCITLISNNLRPSSCVIRYKDTNLKAIHNSRVSLMATFSAVSSDTKIQIWKQFTTPVPMSCSMLRCVIRYKDTNLKAIHNMITLNKLTKELCHPIQRYKFESNSQRGVIARACMMRCVIRYKDTNLKAIHNLLRGGLWPCSAVSSDTKIQIWKQFTTQNCYLF